MTHTILSLNVLVWVSNRKEDQRPFGFRRDPHAVRIFTWNVDHVPSMNRDVVAVDMNETLPENEVDLMIAVMHMEFKSSARIHLDEIGSDLGSVRLHARNARLSCDALEYVAVCIFHRQPFAFADMAKVLFLLPRPDFERVARIHCKDSNFYCD